MSKSDLGVREWEMTLWGILVGYKMKGRIWIMKVRERDLGTFWNITCGMKNEGV